MRYTYDAWNRLVKVTRKQDTDIVIQTAEYDGLGRRVQKVVTKSGELDGSFVYYYADSQAGGSMSGASPGGWSIVEMRDGSSNVLQQVYHGTQYIDEIVAMRLEKGYAVVYQDANWNTIATCDLAGRVLERVFTTPYGSPIIEPETFFGDYDGDGDVDSTDDASLGSGQTCWGSSPSGACRVFDFNHDGTLDGSDETIMTALVGAPSTNRRHENRTVSPTRLACFHQGLVSEFELDGCQVRHRYYSASYSRFIQREPVTTDSALLTPHQYDNGSNLYGYAAHNPNSLTDPLGLSPGGWPISDVVMCLMCDPVHQECIAQANLILEAWLRHCRELYLQKNNMNIKEYNRCVRFGVRERDRRLNECDRGYEQCQDLWCGARQPNPRDRACLIVVKQGLR